MAGPRAICVCACTYQRPDGLGAMLDGLGRQTFADMARPALHVVIADNEGSDQARQVCAEFERRSGIALTYVHEPERGISFARNACLDHSRRPAIFSLSSTTTKCRSPTGWNG